NEAVAVPDAEESDSEEESVDGADMLALLSSRAVKPVESILYGVADMLALLSSRAVKPVERDDEDTDECLLLDDEDTEEEDEERDEPGVKST
ncbi:hypothetical protein KIPB_015351, partial [Kipferlia bialata]